MSPGSPSVARQGEDPGRNRSGTQAGEASQTPAAAAADLKDESPGTGLLMAGAGALILLLGGALGLFLRNRSGGRHAS